MTPERKACRRKVYRVTIPYLLKVGRELSVKVTAARTIVSLMYLFTKCILGMRDKARRRIQHLPPLDHILSQPTSFFLYNTFNIIPFSAYMFSKFARY
jgi:hypothetical protein